MSKRLLLLALLFVNGLLFAQTKEHKTYVKDLEINLFVAGYANGGDRMPVVLTASYYEDEQGNMVLDGPFSALGKERIKDRGDFGWGHADALFEMRGCFNDGLLDGDYSFQKTYNFTSDEGKKAPHEWVEKGSFIQGVPVGEWDRTYKRDKTEYAIHFTIQNGKPNGSFYSQGFNIDQSGSAAEGILERFEEKYRGETTQNSVFYKGVDISKNADLARKYANGQLSVEELEDMGYYASEFRINVLQKTIENNVFLNDFRRVFNESVLETALENRYWNGRDGVCWMKAKGSSISEKIGSFWSPAKVNQYIEIINKTNKYDGAYGLLYYYSDANRYYKQHDIKTVHYEKIKAALDEKKAAMEGAIVEEMKKNIKMQSSKDKLEEYLKSESRKIDEFFDDNKRIIEDAHKSKFSELERARVEILRNEMCSKTAMVDLNDYMKSISKETDRLLEVNKSIIEDAYKSKFSELEQIELDEVMNAIKHTFDEEKVEKMINNYPNKPQYSAFSAASKAKIDWALTKQLQAIEASGVLKKALDQIVSISQERKITKKPEGVIVNDYNKNVVNWEVFYSQSVQQLSEKIASFCPMVSYEILSVDYLENGTFQYLVKWTKQLSKKEQINYSSELVVLEDKRHLDINSFDFAKAKLQ